MFLLPPGDMEGEVKGIDAEDNPVLLILSL